MPGWEELGMQTASNVANGVLGLALGGINDRRQIKQQEKLQNLQIAGSKQLTDYNFQKQMEMWKNTNYPAQMAMLKQAGLNPALIYDHGGGQASTSVSTGNVSGGNAPVGGGEAQAMMAMGLQRQMMQAQVELTKAQTQKTVAETSAVEPGIQKTQQETLNLKTQNAIAEIEKAFQSDTLQNRESMINIGLSKLIEETKILENDRQISDATKLNHIKQVAATLSNTLNDALLKNKQANKTDKELELIKAEVDQINQQIQLNKPDEQMAADGANPRAGTLMKWLYMLLKPFEKINKAINK